MAFSPSSTIQLFNENIDSAYQHQYYFDSIHTQNAYFSNPVKTLSDYTTVRNILPGGSLQTSVYVDGNIDKYASINYMRFKNENIGDKWIYAFITKKVYINEDCTELVFETDVIQTWLFDFYLNPSFVEREHSDSDKIGEHLTPESFNFNDFLYREIGKNTDIGLDVLEDSAWKNYNEYFSEWGYLVGVTKFYDAQMNDLDKNKMGRKQSGIYQGLEFFFFSEERLMMQFLKDYTDNSEDPDGIVFITVLPKFSVSSLPVGYTPEQLEERQGWLRGSSTPVKAEVSFNFYSDGLKKRPDGYVPKNNKLWTSPFFKLNVTNHSGDNVEFTIEDFTVPENATFKIYADISASPSLMCVPLNYKGVAENVDYAVQITGLPQCSFNCDTYKLWLAKNQFSNTSNTVIGLGKMIAGGAVTLASSGVGAGVGVGLIANGASDIFNVIKASETAKKEADKFQSGRPNNNLLTAVGKNRFDFQIQYLKNHQIKMIDDYFTMYGYQTNRVKIPNIHARKYFTYTKTIGSNIFTQKGIPNDDINRIKAVFNNGVTFWRRNSDGTGAIIGNYNVDNTPINE